MISNSKILIPVMRQALQRRSQSVISGPPTQHISKVEKLVLGGSFIASLFVIPSWVLVHIKDYKAHE